MLSRGGRLIRRMTLRVLFHTNGRPRGYVRRMFPSAFSSRTAALAEEQRRSIAPSSRSYGKWVKRHDTLSAADREAIRAHLAQLPYQPLISVIVPTYNTPATVLREMVESVKAQLYPNWELCIADDASPEPHVAALLAELAAGDPRVKWVQRESNGHISAASNSALELASGAFVALLDHDDLLAEHALYEVAVELNAHPDAEIVYSDEDKIDEKGERYDPYFKPDYSYEQLLGQNVINHLGVYRRDSVIAVGGFRLGLEGSQDYDLALRIVHRCAPEQIRHIPAILYHWRQSPNGSSFSQEQLERCIVAARAAIQERLDETGTRAVVAVNPAVPVWHRVTWAIPTPAPLVSILIPTRDRAGLVRKCVDGILDRTDYPHVEILIIDNGSVEPESFALFEELKKDARIRVLRVEGEFNYSALNNAAAREARGEVLLLLNNDIDVIGPHWLGELVGLIMRPDIGVAGAKLLYADNRVQHAGVRLGMGTFDGGDGIAGHVGHFETRQEVGYFGQLALTRDVSAVTGACLAVRREIYEALGGLDEVNLKVAFNDVDFCLRVREAGYRVVWPPFAELHHYESVSRGPDSAPDKVERFNGEARYMRRRWGELLVNDPFHNPNFTNYTAELRLAFPPRRLRPWAMNTPEEKVVRVESR